MIIINREIQNIQTLEKYEEVTLRFKGTLPMGKKFDIQAEFDKEGNIKYCSGASNLNNQIDYYIEMAEVYKEIKKIDKEVIEKIFITSKEIQKEYVDKAERLKQEEDYVLLLKEMKQLEEEKNVFKSKLKRARKQETKEFYEREIERLYEKYNPLWNKKMEIEKQIQSFYEEMRIKEKNINLNY